MQSVLKYYTTKAQSTKEIDKWTLSKLNAYAPQKTLVREWKNEVQTRRKYLQIIYLLKDFYLEYIKSSQHSIRKQTMQSMSSQKI